MEKRVDSKCVFCNICNGDSETRLLYQDEDYIVFKDIRPYAEHHYLVVTKDHIPDAKCLTKEQIGIVTTLKELGRKVLEEAGADLSDSRFGFHWPPFHTVSHLHMHAISPASKMGLLGRIIFRPDSFGFVTPEYVERRIRAQS
ncbi:adenosine 5'-monophosphoramidase HINT3-like [Ischnura elegans]|uniref:adenosine 5'-monophosphoramidase HINT3-like n=1 Tax=Ischnura elegans TaxID=197161 RepID=UPI001ED8BCEF|nr:adenosine 5'-monophosphoramidase HINT3-like [Ischnura elegans]